MFALTPADLAQRIAGCGDGPASFNVESTERGLHVISFDPLYQCSRDEIAQRIEETSAEVVEQARRNRDQFVWQVFATVDELAYARHAAMRRFLDDFENGRRAGRYVTAELPSLPVADNAFDLALCSHFLFLYSQQLDAEFHRAALYEMLRIASEVRVFPLLNLDGQPSSHLGPVFAGLTEGGYSVDVRKVDYEFQRGGNQMLQIIRPRA